MSFDYYIGIDYSGALTSETHLAGLQVYVSTIDTIPVIVKPGHGGNWSRKEIANWLIMQITEGKHFIAGIDHNFSFPRSYFHRYRIKNWDDFLTDFCENWPTHIANVTVEQLRENNPRTGSRQEFRLTEKWTSSAKSVFHFDAPGQVAYSARAGIPWLNYLRENVGSYIHFWPFDGFEVEADKSVIAEVYPSIFRNRYKREDRIGDEHDAYSISRWLSERDRKQKLQHYLKPPLTNSEKSVALREGWILGIC